MMAMSTRSQETLLVLAARLHRGGKEVLHGVDITIQPGEVTALVGANGAGKSSLVMAIAGDLALTSGCIRWGDVDLHGLRPEQVRALGIAVVPEGHRVLGDLSVLDNLKVAAGSLSSRQQSRALDEVLSIFPELQNKLEDTGRALSGGQKQMVCIAQALLARPRFLVIDELSLGLAPMVVKRLADVIVGVAKQGVGVLLIEQFTSLALSMSTNANVMVRGHIAWSGSSAELSAHPEVLHSSYLT
jgi:branched-chain amino acid transport system ATP-binding protein